MFEKIVSITGSSGISIKVNFCFPPFPPVSLCSWLLTGSWEKDCDKMLVIIFFLNREELEIVSESQLCRAAQSCESKGGSKETVLVSSWMTVMWRHRAGKTPQRTQCSDAFYYIPLMLSLNVSLEEQKDHRHTWNIHHNCTYETIHHKHCSCYKSADWGNN